MQVIAEQRSEKQDFHFRYKSCKITEKMYNLFLKTSELA